MEHVIAVKLKQPLDTHAIRVEWTTSQERWESSGLTITSRTPQQTLIASTSSYSQYPRSQDACRRLDLQVTSLTKLSKQVRAADLNTWPIQPPHTTSHVKLSHQSHRTPHTSEEGGANSEPLRKVCANLESPDETDCTTNTGRELHDQWLQHWLEQEANYLPLPSPSLVTLLPPISLPSIGREEDEGGWKGGGTRYSEGVGRESSHPTQTSWLFMGWARSIFNQQWWMAICTRLSFLCIQGCHCMPIAQQVVKFTLVLVQKCTLRPWTAVYL